MKPVPLTQQLVDSIREDILSGHYEPHSNLRQDALAEKYGVSRIPVREALLQLEGEGLVSIQPRRGAIVTPLSLLEVDDVFALRLLLEIRLYHASAPKLDAAAIEMASEANQRYRDAIANQQHAVLGAINAELHMALYREAPCRPRDKSSPPSCKPRSATPASSYAPTRHYNNPSPNTTNCYN